MSSPVSGTVTFKKQGNMAVVERIVNVPSAPDVEVAVPFVQFASIVASEIAAPVAAVPSSESVNDAEVDGAPPPPHAASIKVMVTAASFCIFPPSDVYRGCYGL